ncbi:UBP1-associated protein 2A-like protein [Drosera capensis]
MFLSPSSGLAHLSHTPGPKPPTSPPIVITTITPKSPRNPNPPSPSPSRAPMSPMMSTKKRKLTLKKPQPDPIPQPEPEEEEEQERVEYDEEEQEDDKNDDENSDEEPINKLLEPFSKDQLMSILVSAAESHPNIASNIRTLADEDPVHRKIFIHGLGWDATTETLRDVFGKYGEIEDCKAVVDKATGKSKGYGFVMFRSRSGARRALREPQKRIGNRMTACQLAAVGPVPGGQAGGGSVVGSEHTARKIYVSNVSAEIDPGKLTGYFAKYGEIEEGPLGIDKATGKFKGFCLFVYKTVEGAKRALEEAHKNFDGHMLHCQQAIDGPKMGKQQFQQRNGQFGGRNDNVGIGGGNAVNGGGHFMGNPALAAQAALNPVLGQALTALLASQGAGFRLGNLMGIGSGVNPVIPGVYGNQGVGTSGVLGGYGVPPGLQAAYQNQQLGQGSTGRSGQGSGHLGGSSGPYSSH